MAQEPLALSISLSHKVNLGNYESADVFVCVSGVTKETSEAEIQELIDGPGALAYKACAKALRDKVQTARAASRQTA